MELVSGKFYRRYRHILEMEYTAQCYIGALYWLDQNAIGSTCLKVLPATIVGSTWYCDANGPERIFVGLENPDDVITFTIQYKI